MNLGWVPVCTGMTRLSGGWPGDQQTMLTAFRLILSANRIPLLTLIRGVIGSVAAILVFGGLAKNVVAWCSGNIMVYAPIVCFCSIAVYLGVGYRHRRLVVHYYRL
jgi:hypothetical protein